MLVQVKGIESFPPTFWFKPSYSSATSACSFLTTFIDTSLYVHPTILALAPHRPLLAASAFPRGLAYSFLRVLFRQLHTGRLLPLHVPVGFPD